MPEALFQENLCIALQLAGVEIPALGHVGIDWEANEIVIDHLETATRRLHELDGRPSRSPVHSLYYRLFGGAPIRSILKVLLSNG